MKRLKSLKSLVEAEDYNKLRYDYYVPLLALPGIFNTNSNNIPTCNEVINSCETVNAEHLIDVNKINVGFVWAGNPETSNGQRAGSGGDAGRGSGRADQGGLQAHRENAGRGHGLAGTSQPCAKLRRPGHLVSHLLALKDVDPWLEAT